MYDAGKFEGVVDLFDGGTDLLPWWFCNDDWLRPTKYLIGPDGNEDTEGELAAVHYNKMYYNKTRKHRPTASIS